ncbi:MAG: hypothetical protein ABIC95_01095 [archaeon]
MPDNRMLTSQQALDAMVQYHQPTFRQGSKPLGPIIRTIQPYYTQNSGGTNDGHIGYPSVQFPGYSTERPKSRFISWLINGMHTEPVYTASEQQLEDILTGKINPQGLVLINGCKIDDASVHTVKQSGAMPIIGGHGGMTATWNYHINGTAEYGNINIPFSSWVESNPSTEEVGQQKQQIVKGAAEAINQAGPVYLLLDFMEYGPPSIVEIGDALTEDNKESVTRYPLKETIRTEKKLFSND